MSFVRVKLFLCSDFSFLPKASIPVSNRGVVFPESLIRQLHHSRILPLFQKNSIPSAVSGQVSVSSSDVRLGLYWFQPERQASSSFPSESQIRPDLLSVSARTSGLVRLRIGRIQPDSKRPSSRTEGIKCKVNWKPANSRSASTSQSRLC